MQDAGAPGAIEAVFLDVGGVFVMPDPRIIGPALAEAAGLAAAPSDETLVRAHYAGVAEMDARSWDDPTASRAEGGSIWTGYNHGMALAAGVPADRIDDADAKLREVFEWTTELWRFVIPGSVDALRRLAATGTPLAIVSNSDGTVESVLRQHGICQVGEGEGCTVVVVIDSHVAGYAKPDPRIFHIAMEALAPHGVHDPARVVHVGDTGHADVDGALAAGVRPLHLDPFGDCRRPHDHEHVRSLDDVVALLAR